MNYRFTSDEENTVYTMHAKGATDQEIAKALGRHHKSGPKSIFKLRKRRGWMIDRARQRDVRQEAETTPLEEMTRSQRIEYLKIRFAESPRCKHVFKLLDPDELEVFQDEYFRLLAEIDNVSAAEEQSLFLAIFEFVLAIKAQKNRSDEEGLVRETRDGAYDREDPQFRTQVSERWNKEYNEHMKTYLQLIEMLKLNREQRLKDEIKLKKSFLEYSVQYANKENQQAAAQEILELDRLRDEELKRLIEQGFLFGDTSK